jgi:hypothetical protein
VQDGHDCGEYATALEAVRFGVKSTFFIGPPEDMAFERLVTGMVTDSGEQEEHY